MICKSLPDTPCIQWTGSIAKESGYGNPIQRSGVRKAPHIWAFLDGGGILPPGWQVDHLCNVRACIRFDHLEAVTQAENTRRRGYRMRACKNGHPRTEASVYQWTLPDGRMWQQCRRCKADAQRRYMKDR